MEHVNALLEQKNVKSFLKANDEVVDVVAEEIDLIPDMLKSFALAHLHEFVAEDIKETFKNIRTFAEVATQQAITEICSVYGTVASEEYEDVTGSISDYL